MLRSSVIVFPGSNCDRDVQTAIERVTGFAPRMVWHGDASVPSSDVIVLPGGFSYGDYLRCGAMAAHSPIMKDVVAKANAGTPVIGICNGFQILCESGLLPGALLRNASLHFICRDVFLKVENDKTFFTKCYREGEVIKVRSRTAKATTSPTARHSTASKAKAASPSATPMPKAMSAPMPAQTAPSATSLESSMRRAACSA